MSDFLIGLIVVLVYVGVVATWFFALFDLFARSDLSGLAKGLWLLAIIFLPILGVLAYYAFRPRKPAQELWWQPDNLYAERSSGSVTSEIDTLARLRKEGAISDEEFNSLKERALA